MVFAAVGAAAAVASAANSIANSSSGGGGGSSSGGGGGVTGVSPSGQTVQGNGNSSGTGPFQGLSAYQTAGVEPRATPQMGGSQEVPTPKSDGLMKLDTSTPRPERAANKYQINSTPSTDPGEQYAASDANNIWAARLNKYLDYNSRKLG